MKQLKPSKDAWKLTLPEDQKPIRVKWRSGSIYRVAKGYKQQYGVECEEGFALVVKINTIRLFIALAAQNRWKIY